MEDEGLEDWDDAAFVEELIQVQERVISDSQPPLRPEPPPSSSITYSPPRHLSQRSNAVSSSSALPPRVWTSQRLDKNPEIGRLKMAAASSSSSALPPCVSGNSGCDKEREIGRLKEQECSELKKERDKKDEQLQFVLSRNENKDGTARNSDSANLMFGISYGELFLLIGATAALVGPKDLPRIARMAGRLAGRSIGYVQLARGQFDNVMQQSQARQVQKELQDALAQLDSIPMTRKLMENAVELASPHNGANSSIENPKKEVKLTTSVIKDNINFRTSESLNLHTQATAYAKLAESAAVNTSFLKSSEEKERLIDENGLFTVLPISAESTGMVPKRKENVEGSDIVLEAVLEAEVARNTKDFFSQAENQIQ